MPTLYAQGDLLIERDADSMPSGVCVPPAENGETVLAEGEMTGHRHAIHDAVTMFRDDALARDIPSGLHVGHVRVDSDAVKLVHDEHDAIVLTRGTFRVRRLRELEPRDARVALD